MLDDYSQMQNEEYGEALALAQQYNLDCDLVYQTQWKTHPISIATIQDYLVRDVSCIVYPCNKNKKIRLTPSSPSLSPSLPTCMSLLFPPFSLLV